jgi:hypothetical protein
MQTMGSYTQTDLAVWHHMTRQRGGAGYGAAAALLLAASASASAVAGARARGGGGMETDMHCWLSPRRESPVRLERRADGRVQE